mmetsp:Transcript_27773/g.46971  ORF Transcript_27773/g.46971 Transcript_27773/m.46971 type:complete len:90 (+) Transcript_27773:585-854(+)
MCLLSHKRWIWYNTLQHNGQRDIIGYLLLSSIIITCHAQNLSRRFASSRGTARNTPKILLSSLLQPVFHPNCFTQIVPSFLEIDMEPSL